MWLLNKSLYGTCWAACKGQQHSNKTVSKFNLHPAASYSAVYVWRDDAGILILHLHVNNSMGFASSSKLLNDFKSFLHQEYELKWTEQPTHYYLSIWITVSDDGSIIGLNQSHYIEYTLEQFAMVNCKAAKPPFPCCKIMSPGSDEEVEEAKDLPYQSLFGSLGWIVSTTQMDISYAASQLGRFNSAWTVAHWTTAKNFLPYVHCQPQAILSGC